MERNTLGTFLWITVTTIVMLSLIAFASPFGTYVRDSMDTFTGEYISTNTNDEPVDTMVYTIKVTYQIPDDESMTPPTEERFYKEGEKFSFLPPAITGFTPDKEVVEGIATKNAEFTVVYSYAKYNISFNTNDGDWEGVYSPPKDYIYKSSVSLPTASNISRDNYAFAGWYEDKALTKPASNIKPSDYGDKTYYAKWVPAEYSITYYLNDTTGVDNQYYFSGEPRAEWSDEINLSDYNTFKYGEQVEFPVAVSKFGYKFMGWSTEKDGADKSKYRTQTTESDKSNIVLYAQWERRTYNIYYDLSFIAPNGNTKTYQMTTNGYTIKHAGGKTTVVEQGYPTKYTYGDTITLPSVKLTGYDQYTTYAVWFNKDTAKITINSAGALPSDSLISGYPSGMTQRTQITPSDHSDIYLYVKPIPNNYYIQFDRNAPNTARADTNSNMAKQTFIYDFASNLTANTYQYAGYTFDGWNTRADGTGDSYDNQESIYNLTAEAGKTITLYAQWKRNNVNVVYEYYFQNIGDNAYSVNTTRQRNITVQYGADTIQSASSYIKEFDGFTLLNKIEYDAGTGTEKTIGSDNKFYVMPDGTTKVRIYYTRNTYTLKLQATPGNMFTKITGTGSSISATTLNAGTSATAVSVTKTVKFEDTLSFTATYTSQYKSNGWTTSTNHTGSGNTFTYVMPSENATVTLNNTWNQATITFVPNDAQTPKSNWNGTNKTKVFTYGEKYSATGFPAISRNCYTFSGWYTAASGGTKIKESDTFKNGSATTLYAHWVKDVASCTMEYVNTVNATCTTNGSINYKCKYCGATSSTTISKTGHNQGVTTSKAPTCTAKGWTKRNCTNVNNGKTCNHQLSYVEVDALGHDKYGQCNTAHGYNGSSHPTAVNWGAGNHRCISGGVSNNKVCWKHACCARCGIYSDFNWCLSHGVGTSRGHGISGCKNPNHSVRPQAHDCRINGASQTGTKPCKSSAWGGW